MIGASGAIGGVLGAYLINYPNARVSIYNRNGFLVFSKINYQNDWAGTFDQTGDLLPAGSYYYRIEVPGMEVIEGWLYLTY